MTNMVEPMEVDSSFLDNTGEDEVDTHSNICRDDENSSCSLALTIPETRYENKGGTFTTGIDIFSKDEQQKMIDRAKRFGLANDTNLSIPIQEHDLYTSMGIDEDSENIKYVRLNVLHMRGTENMSTKDIFEYFETYAPSSIEWINDISCNIVWLDKISAARALLGLSKKIVGLGEKNDKSLQKKLDENNCKGDNNSSNENCSIDITKNNQSTSDSEDDNDAINVNAINFPLPPGIWRKGVDCPKSKTILLRFATSSDKKQQNSEKMSDYYKKYGNPNFGGMKGILTDSRKRSYKQTQFKKNTQSFKRNPTNETDDVKDTRRMKNPWGTLSETWGANDSVENDFIRQTRPINSRNELVLGKGNIKERLGSKCPIYEAPAIDESESEESSDSDSEWKRRSKVLRMRMHADDEEEKVQKKRLKQLSKKVQEKMSMNDLRSRLGRSKPQLYHDPIQVIVTNTPETYRNTRQYEEDEEDDVVDEVSTRIYEVEEEEKEEGEWEESETNDTKGVTVEEVTDEEQEDDINDQEEGEEVSSDESSSDISEKEVQGPRGSVIKVIPRAKPRVASTVWARLNHNEQNQNAPKPERRDLRETLKGDLRYKLGYQNRERSPLRIEVKNDKYAQNNSESE